MEWKRAKNIILCVLIFANLFLAVNLGTLIERRWGEQREKTGIAIENLKKRGHTVAEDAEKSLSYSFNIYNVPRDSQFEANIAVGILGQCAKTVKGGGIEEYSSETGLCTFRSGGNFLCEIYGRNIEDSFEKSAEEIVEAMGIKKYRMESLSASKAFFAIDAEEKYTIEDYGITVEQTTRGVQISGRLVNTDSGKRTLIAPDYAKILIMLASSAEEEGQDLDIRDMEIVYFCDYVQADESHIQPYLRLDMGENTQYVNLNSMEIIKK